MKDRAYATRDLVIKYSKPLLHIHFHEIPRQAREFGSVDRARGLSGVGRAEIVPGRGKNSNIKNKSCGAPGSHSKPSKPLLHIHFRRPRSKSGDLVVLGWSNTKAKTVNFDFVLLHK
jgi:hypothetical protein